MKRVTLPQYLIQLAKKLCSNETIELTTYCEASQTDLALLMTSAKWPFATLYEPLCLENLSVSGLFVLLLPYSQSLQQQLKQYKYEETWSLSTELIAIEKQTAKLAKITTHISKEKLIDLYCSLSFLLIRQQIESLSTQTNETQLYQLNNCLYEGVQLINKLSPDEHIPKFIMEHLGDLYINLMLLTASTQKSASKKQMQKTYHKLSNIKQTSSGYGHFFSQQAMSFTQQLRTMRLDDTNHQSKLEDNSNNYLPGAG